MQARLGFDGSLFDAGMRAVAGKAGAYGAQIGSGFGTAIKSRIAGAIGPAALVAGFVAITKAAVNYASELKDLSEQNDLTLQETQKVAAVARDAGIGFERYARSLDMLGQRRKAAVEGNEELRKQFEQYGVTLNDLLDPEMRNIQLLEKMGIAISKIRLTSQQRAELRELGITPNLANSLGGLQGAEAESTDQEIRDADAFSKKIERSMVTAKAFWLRQIFGGRDQFGFAPKPDAETNPILSKALMGLGINTNAPTESTVNGSSDPLKLKQEAELAGTLNKLYEKGLQIQFERLSKRGKELELQRQIRALEIASEEEGDTAAGDKVRRQIAIKQAELGVFKMQRDEGSTQFMLNERQRMGESAGGRTMMALTSVNEKQLKELEQIRKAVTKPKTATETTIGIEAPY